MKFEIQKDKYKKARGGRSRILDIRCEKCDTHLLFYQKDGPGPLKRMYNDRIIDPEHIVGLEAKGLAGLDVMRCSECKEMVAVPYIYKKEERPAFRVFQDAVRKVIVKSR